MEFNTFGQPEGVANKDIDNKRKKKSVRFGGIAKVESVKESEAPKHQPAKRFNESIAESLLRNSQKSIEQAPAESELVRPKTEATEPRVNERPKQTKYDVLERKRPDHQKANDNPKQLQGQSAAEAAFNSDEDGESDTVANNEYREMLAQKLANNQTGGEVVVNLDGNVTEHVVLLREPPAESDPKTAVASPGAAEAAYPVFSRQPEQQHQAQDQQPAAPNATESAPPAPDTLTGGGGGEGPPAGPPEQGRAAAGPPDPERQSNEQLAQTETRIMQPGEAEALYGGGAATPNAGPSVSPSERPATKQELDQAFARSAQIHEQRGVLSGLLFGTWLANRGLRRRQKHETKDLQQQSKQLNQLTKQYDVASTSQEKQQTHNERRFKNIEKRFVNPLRPEKVTANKLSERLPLPNPKPSEQLTVPQNHHLETSAWHSIEVDNKTGKPVETQAFEYGHEYFQERAHENGPIDQRNAAAGELAIVAATGASVLPNKGDDAKSSVPSATQQGAPSSMKDKAKDKAKLALSSIQSSGSSSQAGPIWPWAVALLAIVIVLALLIH